MRPTLVCLLALALPAAAADPPTAENPEFTGWSKFKPGTTVTLKMTNTFGKTTNTSEAVHTLVKAGKDELTLNKSLSFTIMGSTRSEPAKPVAIKPRVPIDTRDKPEDFAILKPKKTVEEGEEALKVGKTEYKTKWYLAKDKTLTGDAEETKVWTCPDVPGLLVKKVVTYTGKNPSTKTTEVSAVTIKK